MVQVKGSLDQPEALMFAQLIVFLIEITIFHVGESLICHFSVTHAESRPACCRADERIVGIVCPCNNPSAQKLQIHGRWSKRFFAPCNVTPVKEVLDRSAVIWLVPMGLAETV